MSMPGHAYADLMQDAVLDYQFQDFEQAEDKFRQIIEQDPDNISAHYYLGMVLQQNGKVKEAVSHLELVKEKTAPGQVEGIDDALASAYIAAGTPEKALPIYKMQHEKNRQDESLSFTYAKALQASGDAKAARSIYQTLIASKGQYADAARFQMAQIFTDKKAYATAMQQLNEIDEKSPYGDAAKSYKDALAPAVKPLSLYVSSEWFYNSNASSKSSDILGQGSTPVGSQGLTQIVALNSRPFEWTEDLRAKIGYLYYGMFHRSKVAKSNDFYGHFINPALTMHTTPNTQIELKGDIQLFYFAHQKLSNNMGGTLTATWESDDGNEVVLHSSFLDKKHTTSFFSAGTSTSLAYLDAKAIRVGISGSLTDESERFLSVDYNFKMERPTHTGSADPIIGPKSRDSKYNEHALQIDASLPFTGWLSQVSISGSASYSYKNYLNRQDAAGLNTDAAGLLIKAISASYGGKLQIKDVVKIWGYGVNTSAGYEHSNSRSKASALTYKGNKYMGEISALF